MLAALTLRGEAAHACCVRRAAVGLATVLVLFAGAAPASATLSEALSLEELVLESTHVVAVTALRETSRRDERQRIVSDVELRVDEVMKGPARVGQTLTVLRLGGAIGDLGMHVEGEARFRPGARYLVFLRSLRDGRTLRPVGMSQGVMPLEAHAQGLMVLPGGGGLALVQRAGGALVPAPPALLHPEPLDAVRGRIGHVVAGEQRGSVVP